jgi:hypothetical protein
MQTKFASYDDLPDGLKERVSKIASPNEHSWVNKAIPALGGKTFLEQLNEEDGYEKVCQYLTKVEGYFG